MDAIAGLNSYDTAKPSPNKPQAGSQSDKRLPAQINAIVPARAAIAITIPILLYIIWQSLDANGKHSLETYIASILFEPYRDIANASDTGIVVMVATWALVGMALSRLDLQGFRTARSKPGNRLQDN